jgi:hypothetical protein
MRSQAIGGPIAVIVGKEGLSISQLGGGALKFGKVYPFSFAFILESNTIHGHISPLFSSHFSDISAPFTLESHPEGSPFFRACVQHYSFHFWRPSSMLQALFPLRSVSAPHPCNPIHLAEDS